MQKKKTKGKKTVSLLIALSMLIGTCASVSSISFAAETDEATEATEENVEVVTDDAEDTNETEAVEEETDTDDTSTVKVEETDETEAIENEEDTEETEEAAGIATYSSSVEYGFDESVNCHDGYKHDAQSALYEQKSDGSTVFNAYFESNQSESWVDKNVTFEVEDVTPSGYQDIFSNLGIKYSKPQISGIEEKGSTNFKIELPDQTSGSEVVSSKKITITGGPSVRAVKVIAKINGEIVDYYYVCSYNTDFSSDYDNAIYKQVREDIESQLWTSDMTIIEKLDAVAWYMIETTHYPATAATDKEANPTIWNKWAVDDTELFFNLGNDTTLSRISQLQGGVGTCTEVYLLRTIATDDLGLKEVSTQTSEEGVYMGTGVNSSVPSYGYHYTLYYQDGNGNTEAFDAFGKEGACGGSCESKILPLKSTFTAPKRKLSTCTITLSSNSYTYNGTAKTPTVKVVSDTGVTLKEGTDYSISYSNNTNPGTATVTLKGKGNFTGTVKKTFTIDKKSQTIKVSKTSYTKTYGASTFSLGAKLTKGDGKLTYKSSNTGVATVSSSGKVTLKKAGSATITVTAAATDNYKKTTKTVKVKVNKAASGLKVTKNASKTYKKSKLKNAKKTFTIKTSKKTNAKVEYSLSGSKSKKYLKVNSKGEVTVKKGTPKGTYKINVKTAANSKYKSGAKTVTVEVTKMPKTPFLIKHWENEYKDLATPKNVTVTSGTKSIKVKWKKVKGANKYCVLRTDDRGYGWDDLTYTSKTSFKDKTAEKGVRYYYCVQAVKVTGKYNFVKRGSEYSKVKSGKIK